MDGLRFVAVFLVLIEHFAQIIGTKIHASFFGVDLFFVISGFLITESLFVAQQGSLKQKLIVFYKKRFLWIFPIYYLLLILALFYYPPFKEIAAWAFTYTVNYYQYATVQTVPAAFGGWRAILYFLAYFHLTNSREIYGLLYSTGISYFFMLIFVSLWFSRPSRQNVFSGNGRFYCLRQVHK